ncbi:MAG: hypothetical protein ONA69_07835 [candidate division KSB1 bacterium]|nr:hypothetical protein [candidate division KSB1 bacterium]MDZ7346686.1 hypothetical protein [candidate division KSB1 bacterium]
MRNQPSFKGKVGGNHYADFIEALRVYDKKLLNAFDVTANLSPALAHLGNISYRLGRQLEFDADSETFVNDIQANAMLSRAYRSLFMVPEKV